MVHGGEVGASGSGPPLNSGLSMCIAVQCMLQLSLSCQFRQVCRHVWCMMHAGCAQHARPSARSSALACRMQHWLWVQRMDAVTCSVRPGTHVCAGDVHHMYSG